MTSFSTVALSEWLNTNSKVRKIKTGSYNVNDPLTFFNDDFTKSISIHYCENDSYYSVKLSYENMNKYIILKFDTYFNDCIVNNITEQESLTLLNEFKNLFQEEILSSFPQKSRKWTYNKWNQYWSKYF